VSTYIIIACDAAVGAILALLWLAMRRISKARDKAVIELKATCADVSRECSSVREKIRVIRNSLP
jgi:hypothetical protein